MLKTALFCLLAFAAAFVIAAGAGVLAKLLGVKP